MWRRLRGGGATRVLHDLDILRKEWEVEATGIASGVTAVSRRERFKLLEAENGGSAFVAGGKSFVAAGIYSLGSFVSGSLVTRLIKHLIGS